MNNYYNDYDKVKELIKLGKISSLREKVKPDNNEEHSFDNPHEDVTIAYHRDRGEDWDITKPDIHSDIYEFNDYINDGWIEYIYLYDEKNKKWLWDYINLNKKTLELKDLSKEFNKKIALKSGYYFMIFKKEDIPFFNDLKMIEKQVKINDEIYNLYEAKDWDTAKKVDLLMGNDELGYDIDKYEFNKNIEI